MPLPNLASLQHRNIQHTLKRSIEEIALAGRCGIAVSDFFQRINPQEDNDLRKYIWNILITLRHHLSFYRCSVDQCKPVCPNEPIQKTKAKKTWPSTLIPVQHQGSPLRGPFACEKGKKRKRSEPMKREIYNVSNKSFPTFVAKRTSTHVIERKVQEPIGSIITDTSELFYECSFVSSDIKIVACEQLRLMHLGITDPNILDADSLTFSLLEMIGRQKELGENAVDLIESKVFGDARKIHYLLDVLIGLNLIRKMIVSYKSRRFNMLYLTRFLPQNTAELMSSDDTIKRETFCKRSTSLAIAKLMRMRQQTSYVLADICRDLNVPKRQQEILRNYLLHEVYADPEFPIEIFMARCSRAKRASEESKGRKLWCVRMRENVAEDMVQVSKDECKGLVIEIGLLEQIYDCIKNRRKSGATIPEIRDMLGLPTFRLPYKLAQGLIAQYHLDVERVLLGKHTVYRMYVPEEKSLTCIPPTSKQIEPTLGSHAHAILQDTLIEVKVEEDKPIHQAPMRSNSLKEASRDAVISCHKDKRRQFMIERIQKAGIISIPQLRRDIVNWEREIVGCDAFVGISSKSVLHLVAEIVKTNDFALVSIQLPILTSTLRTSKCKCVATREAMNDKRKMEEFMRSYAKNKQIQCEAAHQYRDNVLIVQKTRDLELRNDVLRSAHEKQLEVIHYTPIHCSKTEIYKQNARLGTFHGLLYRCQMLHILLWKNISVLRQKYHRSELSNSIGEEEIAKASGTGSNKTIVCTVQEIIKLVSVKQYIQLFGVSVLMTDSEEVSLRMSLSRDDAWESLDRSIYEKIRKKDSKRVLRVLHRLAELHLVKEIEDVSDELISETQRHHDALDDVVSRVAIATVSGGMIYILPHVRIQLDHESTDAEIDVILNELGYVDNCSEGSLLYHEFRSVADVERYWAILQSFCLYGGRLKDNGRKDADDCEVIVRPAPVRQFSMYHKAAWGAGGMSKRQSRTARKTDHASAPQCVSHHLELEDHTPKKRYFACRGNTVEKRPRHSNAAYLKRLKMGQEEGSPSENGRRKSKDLCVPVTSLISHSLMSPSQIKADFSSAQHVSRRQWTEAEDAKLIEMYIKELSCQWFTDVPTAFQREDETLAFRNTNISRSSINWKSLMNTLPRGKLRETQNRIRMLLQTPYYLAKVTNIKASITAQRNASGIFHEEKSIKESPRLAALHIRAFQIVSHDPLSYTPKIANEMLGHWKEDEIKLIWRYLWLAGIAARSYRRHTNQQVDSGYCLGAEYFRRNIDCCTYQSVPNHTSSLYRKAAEYMNFIRLNHEEVISSQEDSNSIAALKYDFGDNLESGAMAFELSSMTLGYSEWQIVCVNLNIQQGYAISMGVSGHLERCTNMANTSYFTNNCWTVRCQYGATLEESEPECVSEDEIHTLATPIACTLSKSSLQNLSTTLQEFKVWIRELLEAVKEDGISFDSIRNRARIDLTWLPESKDGQVFDRLSLVLHEILGELVAKRLAIRVNVYTEIRYVLTSYSEIWILTSREKAESSPQGLNAFIARPWLHLDGSVNANIVLNLKLRLCNVIMRLPGITDRKLHHLMNKIIGLQDMRFLLDEMASDKIVFARVVVQARISLQTTDAFSMAFCMKTRIKERELRLHRAPDLHYIDEKQMQLHYYPTQSCVQNLGAVVCDLAE